MYNTDIIFSTRDFEWAYGKRPSGRGWWYFSFKGHEFVHTGLYSEAKKACQEYVKSVMPEDYRGIVTVKVGT